MNDSLISAMTEIFRFGEKNCVRPIGYDWSSAVGGSAWSMSGGAGFKTRRSIMVFLKTFFFASMPGEYTVTISK